MMIDASRCEFTTDWFSPMESEWREVLAPLVGIPDGRYLEIGCFEGRSLVWMMQTIFHHPTARAVAIDLCRPAYAERLRTNLAVTGLTDRVDLRAGLSRHLLWQLPRSSFDAIYVDGSHLAADVLFDVVCAWELLKPGGIMMIDDYALGTSLDLAMRRPIAADLRTREAIDGFLVANRRDIDVVYRHYQLALRKRVPFLARPEIWTYGNPQFCSALRNHLYYWDTRTLVLLPRGHRVQLDAEQAALVEEVLRAEAPGFTGDATARCATVAGSRLEQRVDGLIHALDS